MTSSCTLTHISFPTRFDVQFGHSAPPAYGHRRCFPSLLRLPMIESRGVACRCDRFGQKYNLRVTALEKASTCTVQVSSVSASVFDIVSDLGTLPLLHLQCTQRPFQGHPPSHRNLYTWTCQNYGCMTFFDEVAARRSTTLWDFLFCYWKSTTVLVLLWVLLSQVRSSKRPTAFRRRSPILLSLIWPISNAS